MHWLYKTIIVLLVGRLHFKQWQFWFINYFLQAIVVMTGSTHILRVCWSVKDWIVCPVLPAPDRIILVVCSYLVTFLNLHPNFHLQRLFKITTQALLRVFYNVCVISRWSWAALHGLLWFNPSRQLRRLHPCSGVGTIIRRVKVIKLRGWGKDT